MSRVQSPSSINTYKQCPRKYYYKYIEELPEKGSIHLVRGKIVHEALETFFRQDWSAISSETFVPALTEGLKSHFARTWMTHQEDLRTLDLSEDELVHYYQDTLLMLANWHNHFLTRLQQLAATMPVHQAFEAARPRHMEERFESATYQVAGVIDYIEHDGDLIKIMDYKTGKHSEITAEYKLQLAIYALLYDEHFGRKPDKVGLWVLRYGEVTMPVDDSLLELAKHEIRKVHAATQSDNIDNYPMQPGPLCKWRTGQCDFYDLCFNGKGQRRIGEFGNGKSAKS